MWPPVAMSGSHGGGSVNSKNEDCGPMQPAESKSAAMTMDKKTVPNYVPLKN